MKKLLLILLLFLYGCPSDHGDDVRYMEGYEIGAEHAELRAKVYETAIEALEKLNKSRRLNETGRVLLNIAILKYETWPEVPDELQQEIMEYVEAADILIGEVEKMTDEIEVYEKRMKELNDENDRRLQKKENESRV